MSKKPLDRAIQEVLREASGSETVEERLARLGHTFTLKPEELEALEIANPLVKDKVFSQIATARIISQEPTLILPPGRYDHCSRGRGWARKGKGDAVSWGDKVQEGYEVGPGTWVQGSNDGFNRKGSIHWEVEAVPVGQGTWLVAN